MKLTVELDSLDELRAFADFVSRGREQIIGAATPHVDLVLPSGAVAHIVEAAKQDEAKPTGNTPLEGTAEPTGDAGDGEQSGSSADTGDSKPRRKRRTKAEIEAERAAQTAEAPAPQQPAGTLTPEEVVAPQPPAEVGQPGAGVSADAAPPGFVSAPPAGETPFDAAPPAAAPAASALPEDSPTRAQIELRQAEIMADPATGQPQFVITHARAAREYISKHGAAKYNETQQMWGFTPDIMKYTPEQRALHLATMQVLGPLLNHGAQ